MLESFPYETFRIVRINNYSSFRLAIAKFDKVEVMGPEILDAPAMALVRLSNVRLRDALRAQLTEENIYTAVLWPITNVQAASWHRSEDIDFSNETLAVHVDARYSPDDMRKVAGRIGALAEALFTEQ